MNNNPMPWEEESQQESYYHYTRENIPAYTQPRPAEKKKKERSAKGVIALALCVSLVGGAAGAGGVLLTDRLLNKEESGESQPGQVSVMLEGQREKTTLQVDKVNTEKEMNAAEVYASNVHSTVGITTSVTTNYWGYTTTSAASGSGFIISSDGYILTNFHVIEDSDSISVSLYDGSTYEAALIGYDESNDIAVLKIDAADLIPVILGDSDALYVGDQVVAIGNPLGELTFSLTAGYVSAKDRQVTLSSTVTMNLIQTDCAINSGNSGGALFNMYGEVVGVTNAKYSSSTSSKASIDNIGFAIPINSVRGIVEDIIEKGYIARPYIGIHVADVPEQTQMYGVPAGAAVQAVQENGPAHNAGLETGDVIIAADGKTMTSAELIDYVGSREIGSQIRLRIFRKGEQLELSVTVGEQKQAALGEESTKRYYSGPAGIY